jgi:hypothetical protein
MTIRLAEACVNNMNTTAASATNQTTTTNFLAQVDMAEVNACINNYNLQPNGRTPNNQHGGYLGEVIFWNNQIALNPNAKASTVQRWAALASKYQQQLQALQTGNQSIEQQWNQLPQAGQTLVSNDNNAIAQMASIMQSINAGPGYLSNLMAGAL